MGAVRGLFERIGRDGRVEKDEIARYLESLGVGQGWLGKVKIKAAIALFMARFDRDPRDGGVSWDEVLAYGKPLIPRDLRSGAGGVDLALARREYAQHGGPSGVIDEAGALAYVKSRLPAVVPTNLAEALARLMLDALDEDGDGKLSWPDFEGALKEINAEVGAAPR